MHGEDDGKPIAREAGKIAVPVLSFCRWGRWDPGNWLVSYMGSRPAGGKWH